MREYRPPNEKFEFRFVANFSQYLSFSVYDCPFHSDVNTPCCGQMDSKSLRTTLEGTNNSDYLALLNTRFSKNIYAICQSNPLVLIFREDSPNARELDAETLALVNDFRCHLKVCQ